MSRLSDLVRDSKLRTRFHDTVTIHSYLEVDETGGRFSREEHWKWERFLGRGGFGQVRLQRRVARGTKGGDLRAVKVIEKLSDSSSLPDFDRELEAIAKFSNDRVRLTTSSNTIQSKSNTQDTVQTMVREIVWLV
jgi:serine/threonine protein kinase